MLISSFLNNFDYLPLSTSKKYASPYFSFEGRSSFGFSETSLRSGLKQSTTLPTIGESRLSWYFLKTSFFVSPSFVGEGYLQDSFSNYSKRWLVKHYSSFIKQVVPDYPFSEPELGFLISKKRVKLRFTRFRKFKFLFKLFFKRSRKIFIFKKKYFLKFKKNDNFFYSSRRYWLTKKVLFRRRSSLRVHLRRLIMLNFIFSSFDAFILQDFPEFDNCELFPVGKQFSYLTFSAGSYHPFLIRFDKHTRLKWFKPFRRLRRWKFLRVFGRFGHPVVNRIRINSSAIRFRKRRLRKIFVTGLARLGRLNRSFRFLSLLKSIGTKKKFFSNLAKSVILALLYFRSHIVKKSRSVLRDVSKRKFQVRSRFFRQQQILFKLRCASHRLRFIFKNSLFRKYAFSKYYPFFTKISFSTLQVQPSAQKELVSVLSSRLLKHHALVSTEQLTWSDLKSFNLTDFEHNILLHFLYVLDSYKVAKFRTLGRRSIRRRLRQRSFLFKGVYPGKKFKFIKWFRLTKFCKSRFKKARHYLSKLNRKNNYFKYNKFTKRAKYFNNRQNFNFKNIKKSKKSKPIKKVHYMKYIRHFRMPKRVQYTSHLRPFKQYKLKFKRLSIKTRSYRLRYLLYRIFSYRASILRSFVRQAKLRLVFSKRYKFFSVLRRSLQPRLKRLLRKNRFFKQLGSKRFLFKRLSRTSRLGLFFKNRNFKNSKHALYYSQLYIKFLQFFVLFFFKLLKFFSLKLTSVHTSSSLVKTILSNFSFIKNFLIFRFFRLFLKSSNFRSLKLFKANFLSLTSLSKVFFFAKYNLYSRLNLLKLKLLFSNIQVQSRLNTLSSFFQLFDI
jgi:hypothetical protein